MREVKQPDGTKRKECVYTPHSFRATVATMLFDAGVPILDVQQLLGHKDVKTTMGYYKRRRSAKESASHKLLV